MNYFDWNNFGTGAQQTYVGSPNWYGGEMQNPLEQQLTNATTLFKQQFQNLLGRPPTADELGAFQVNAVAPNMPQTYQDASGLAQSYITSNFAPQAAQYQQQQQTNQLQKSEGQLQNVVNQSMGNTAKQFSDPTSQLYQTLAGSMNNLGITPGSGAFQAGAGSTIANAGLNAENAGLSAIGIPTIQGIQGLTGYPFSQATQGGGTALGDLQNQFNFTQEGNLAKMLQEMMQPSGAQGILGMASGAAQGLGALGQGAGGAKTATSYVCKELIRRGLLCEMDMDDFHAHIMPALFKKGRAFWKYAMDGQKLVDAVNAKGLDWKAFKPLLFDRVMEESDPASAVDLYADACHQLCISADRSLWDERVYRESFWDSLPFLPRLLVYTPFLKALAQCVRIKMLLLYDRPRCSHV